MKCVIGLTLAHENIVDSMIALALLNIERNAYEQAVLDGIIAESDWTPVTEEDIKLARATIWASIDLFAWGQKEIATHPHILERCAIMNEVGFRMTYLQDLAAFKRWPLEYDIFSHFEQFERNWKESGCPLKQIELYWGKGLNVNDATAAEQLMFKLPYVKWWPFPYLLRWGMAYTMMKPIWFTDIRKNLDHITIDQLRAFVTVVDSGSFTAASKRLQRVQSAISYAISSLESELGLQLFDRSTRTPTLTSNGESLLVEAREILRRTEVLQLHAKDISKGIEATLSVVVDSLFPVPALVEICKSYAARFPRIPLSLHMESLGAAIDLLEKNVCDFGIVGPYASSAQFLSQESLGSSPLKTVVSPNHPLAVWDETVPSSELEQHNQIVITDRSALTSGTSFGVLSNQIWKVSDLHSKYALIKGELGWGTSHSI